MTNTIFKIVSIITISIFLIWGCSSDKDSPTEPTHEDETLIETTTIASSGGEIGNENFTLIIPAGAVDSSFDMSLFSNSVVNPFGTDAVSATYRLAGFPDRFTDTLHLRIKYDGTLSNSSFIAMCEEVFVKSLGRMDTTFHLFNATDSSGYLICNIPPTTTSKSSFKPRTFLDNNEPAASVSMIWSAITGYLDHLTTGGHFKIAYPFKDVTSGDVINLDSCLEEAYTDFKTVGFSYTARTSWPMEVTVKKLEQNIFGYAASSPLGLNYDDITFNSRWTNSYTTIRATVGHEFFHCIQAMYDSTRSAMSKSKGWYYPQYWLDEATAVWSEEMFTSNVNYVSAAFLGLEDEPFKGVHAGITGGRDDDHGYGMAPVIKDLFTRKGAAGNAFIVQIYNNIKKNTDPVRALVDAYGAEPIVWLADFYAAYMTGTYYNVVPDNFITADVDTFDIGQPDFAVQSITMPYPDMSASIFVINPDRPDFDAEDSLVLTASADGRHPDIVVLREKSGTWQLLDNKQERVVVGDLPTLALGGWMLVAVVVNDEYMGPDYNTMTDIEFQVELLDKMDLTAYFKFNFGFEVYGRGTNYLDDTFFVTYEDGFGNYQTGSFSGNIFTSTWDTTYVTYSGDTIRDWGTFSAAFDQNANNISSYNLLDTTHRYSPAINTYEVTEVTGTNVPFDYTYDNDLYFSIDSAATCDCITAFKYHYYDPFPGSYWTRSISYECNDDSHVRINFYDN